jgi:hypothetical protein
VKRIWSAHPGLTPMLETLPRAGGIACLRYLVQQSIRRDGHGGRKPGELFDDLIQTVECVEVDLNAQQTGMSKQCFSQ